MIQSSQEEPKRNMLDWLRNSRQGKKEKHFLYYKVLSSALVREIISVISYAIIYIFIFSLFQILAAKDDKEIHKRTISMKKVIKNT